MGERSFTNFLPYVTAKLDFQTSGGAKGSGTGFFFEFRGHIHQGRRANIPVIITNRHVIEDSDVIDFRVHLAQPDSINSQWDQGSSPSGRFIMARIATSDRSWVRHPTEDLAALPVATLLNTMDSDGSKVFYRPLYDALILQSGELPKLDAVEEVFMVGYPTGLWDAANNMPIIRRGTTAVHPALNFEGKRHGLVDIACFPGSSGSPLVIVEEVANPGTGEMIRRVIFLGVLFGGYQWNACGEVVAVDIPASLSAQVRTQIPIHLGRYIHANVVLNLEALILAAQSGSAT